ncbi:ComEC/Rec2 family competence protein [Flavobacterium sp.]|jgi:competence protein ComEC|uniref:ComEC/Rec2 family competence protein n=1 Tax=Flavobacterium sp. TaxID=239 RepID=UPI0037BE326F
MKILHFPLAKISLAFIIGIVSFQYYKPSPIWVFGSVLFCVFLLLVFHLLSRTKNNFKLIFGVLSLLTSLLLGVASSIIHKETYNSLHYINQIKDYENQHLIRLVINEKLKNTQKNTRYISTIRSVDKQQSFGKIILNIKKPNQIDSIKIGAELNVIGMLYKNKGSFNPNQFDYGKYLENQEIYAQVYANETQINIVGTQKTIWSQFSNFRTKIIENLALSNFKKEELNILIALLLGQQQDISPEILKDYQYAGAVHILSVSGLHVGFILMFITFLLKPMSNSKRNAILKLVIILVSLWTYGILAGLSASVVRSVTMFSFVAIGIHLKRTVNIFHTLVVSMLLILLWKPSFLFDVGFQLSYLALFFILWVQPLLSNIWQPKNRIIQYIWDIVTVSTAAQIGAMPLSIYYFHQFPGLFFITNIIVLPLLGVIMIIGLIAIIIACFGIVPFVIAKPLEFLIEFLNYIIHWVATFEDFIIKNISFNKEMLVASYLVIIFSVLWFKKNTFQRLFLTLLSIISLQCVFIYTKFKAENTDEFIVFNAKKHSIITERKKDLITVYSNDSILENIDNNLAIQSYLIGNFCKIEEKKNIGNLFYFKNKKILIIDSSSVYLEKTKPDILIVINSPKINLLRVFESWKPEQVVIDGSNYKSYARLWEATCRKEKIPFHNTNEKGFYKL